MSDTTTTTNTNSAQSIVAWFNMVARRSEILFSLGIVSILVLLIMPMPSWLLDFSLAISLTFSVLVLMTCLLINKPLEFSSFPTVLLVATMLRLALNLASTRLILSKGHEGTSAAGHVIEAFGNFVMGGNFVIGIIVFIILAVVNFVVITKGSGRIAEVSARFTLDAMPGKQMAIDADLSAGLIDEQTAKERRKELEDESTFFGAMDGAAKFVRGDALAGIMITAINIVGGIIIGTLQHNMALIDAGNTYTLLTVGDGLVSQIPALVVSTAAGMLVAKAGVSGSADKALFGQLSGYPSALGLSSFLMLALSFLPGIPKIPFMMISFATGYLSWRLVQETKKREETARIEEVKKEAESEQQEQPISAALHIDQIKLELGFNLIQLVQDPILGQRLTDQIKAIRKQLALEAGFVLPAVRIQDNLLMPQNKYSLKIKEIEAGSGEIMVGRYLVMDPHGLPIEISGEDTLEPTFGLPARWIHEQYREEALFRGLTVVDPPTVVTTHLTEVIKENMSELLSYAETQKLIDKLEPEQQKIVSDIVPQHITISGIQRVLQMLLSERISIRDLPAILEAIAEIAPQTRSLVNITEHVRTQLARQICQGLTSHNGYIPLVVLSPEWENVFMEAIAGNEDGKYINLAPSKLQDFMSRLKTVFENLAQQGENPVLVTGPTIRPYIRSILTRSRSITNVISQNEIHPKAKIKTVGQVI